MDDLGVVEKWYDGAVGSSFRAVAGSLRATLRRSPGLELRGEFQRPPRCARGPAGSEAQPMITIESLTKRYGGFTAVDDVTFTARPGRVTGFLGPNGAGKSTTMRVMVGLTPPTVRRASPSTASRFADLPNPGLEVGVLLDASAQHAGRTGREILTIAARTMGLPQPAGRRDARPGQPDREGGRAPRAQLLPRHAPAARHRHRPDRRPGGADPRRAGQRARPGRHPLDARPAAVLRRPGRHRAALLAPAARDRGHRRRHRRDRQRPDRRAGHQGRAARRRRDPRPQRDPDRARPTRSRPPASARPGPDGVVRTAARRRPRSARSPSPPGSP